MLETRKLHAWIGDKQILGGVDIRISGITAVLGPNGSGKSTLCRAIMGSPNLRVEGDILLDGEDISSLGPDERFRKGIFMVFQHPPDIPGLRIRRFLRTIYRGDDFEERMDEALRKSGFPESHLSRDLSGLSGGERKKFEALQIFLLRPRVILVDEIDSGMDIDGIKAVARSLKEMKDSGSDILIITHYSRILDYLNPDSVYLMKGGRIHSKGGMEIVKEIEEHGYGN